ncbi:MAG: hypothetical protein IJW37_01195 [Lachnospiraceae bacterium]|nr:hypothetical protein [Lachnospiraceae bacterium]
MNLQPIAKHFPMFMRRGTQHFVVAMWRFYIGLVARTSKIEFDGIEEIDDNRMLGFWHEDSYCMQLLLRELNKYKKSVHVIVTSERRGDYIAEMVSHYGSKPMRLPDGLKMRSFLSDLKEASKEEKMTLAAAMDGPSGPYRKPKRLLFMLAHEAKKSIVYVRYEKKGMITLPWRWDKYRIPLPFSKLKCKMDYFGEIEQTELRNFNEYAERRFGDAISG